MANKYSKQGVMALNILFSIVINIVDELLGTVVKKFGELEKHKTYTYFFVSIAKKLSRVNIRFCLQIEKKIYRLNS